MGKQYKTLIVSMTGNMFYPRVTIRREGKGQKAREYPVNTSDLKRIQTLLDTTQNRIYTDIENSKIEVLYVKQVEE